MSKSDFSIRRVNAHWESKGGVAILLAILTILGLSCEKEVSLNNPFDPKVPLLAPTDLRILSMEEITVTLGWKTNAGTTNENQTRTIATIIQQSTNRIDFRAIDTVFGSVATDTITETFIPGMNYYFRVCTMAGSNVSFNSNTVAGSVSSHAPTGLVADSISETQRQLSWQDHSTSEIGFLIQRKLGPLGPYATLGQVSPNDTSFVDTTTILTDATYFYRVCAVYAGEILSDFDSLTVAIPFPAPDGISISSLTVNSAQLQWNDNSTFEDGFAIERCEKGGMLHEYARVGQNVSHYTDPQMDTAKAYQYRLYAFTRYNRSKESKVLTTGYVPALSNVNYLGNFSSVYNVIQPSVDGQFIFFGGTTVPGSGYTYGTFLISNPFQGGYWRANHGTYLTCAAFSKDNSHLVTASDDSLVLVWSMATHDVSLSIPFPQPVRAIIFSADGSRIVCACEDRTIRCWNASDGSLLYTTQVLNDSITAMDLSADGTILATASGKYVTLWHAATGALIYTYPPTPTAINALKLSSTNLIGVISGHNKLDVFDVLTRSLRFSGTGFNANTNAFTFDEDGLLLILYADQAGVFPRGVFFWRTSDGQLLKEQDYGFLPIVDLMFAPRKKRLIVTHDADQDLRSSPLYYEWEPVSW
jgi:hypothetical protein